MRSAVDPTARLRERGPGRGHSVRHRHTKGFRAAEWCVPSPCQITIADQFAVMATGSDQERHLAGCSALFNGSQESRIDPTAPGLRQAAFWVYARQCLYNSSVYSVTPNVNLKHVLLEIPVAFDHISELRSETGWANYATWLCANVMDFAFGSDKQELSQRLQKWHDLSVAVEDWRARRPTTFQPLYASEAGESGSGTPFPEYLFTADHHGNRTTSLSESDVD